MSKTNPARGMRDLLPADVRRRNYVIGTIKKVYESYGYEPLETPAVENLDTLMGKYGDEGNQLIFKVLKRGEKLNIAAAAKESDLSDLALRYDLTVPLARVTANNRNELPKFFKRYQIQPVWRADRPAKGRFREFYQCDVDAIGSSSAVVEAEQIAAVSSILDRLGFKDFTVRINHRQLLSGMLDAAGIPPDRHVDALIILDKLDKIGAAGVANEFTGRGIGGAEMLLELFKKLHTLGNPGVLETLADFVGENAPALKAISELRSILDLSGQLLADISTISIDASLARGLSYYTGAIMEINVPDLAGSLGGGGRYDGLIGMFGKEQIPACGFSLGLERILVVMEERGMFPPEIAVSTPADVMITLLGPELVNASLALAKDLRGAGLRVAVYPEVDKFAKQMKYADAIKVPFVCILGDTEFAEGSVTIKNMRTGEQESVDRSQIATRLADQ